MKTTDPLVQIILEKRAREKIVASQRIGKLSKNKCQKTTFRDLKNTKKD